MRIAAVELRYAISKKTLAIVNNRIPKAKVINRAMSFILYFSYFLMNFTYPFFRETKYSPWGRFDTSTLLLESELPCFTFCP